MESLNSKKRIINYDVINKLLTHELHGDRDMFSKLFNLFKKSYATDYKRIFKCQTHYEIKQIAHKLKSGARLFGAESLTFSLLVIENQIDHSVLESQINEIDDLFKVTISEIDRYFNSKNIMSS